MKSLGKILPLFTLALVIPSSSPADSWANVLTASTAFRLEKAQRQRNINVPGPLELFLPGNLSGMSATITTRFENAGVDPRDMNEQARGGRLKLNYGCFQSIAGFRNLGRSKVKLKPWGVAFAQKEINDLGTCQFLQIGVELTGKRTLEEGTNFTISSTIQIRSPNASDDCAKRDVLCFHGDRFRAQVDWRDFDGQSGSGIGVPESDEAGSLYFFDPDNWEMLVKVLDGCDSNAPFNNWWVFYASTTNVEYTLRVTDTQTGEVKSYDNALGQRSPAITDTDAFATCP